MIFHSRWLNCLLLIVLCACSDGEPADSTPRTAWRTFTSSDGLPINEIRVVHQDRDGNYWFGTKSAGIARWDGKTWTKYRKRNGLAGNGVVAFAEDAKGRLWCAGDGVSLWQGGAWKSFPSPEVFPGGEIFSISRTPKGRLLFNARGGAYEYVEGQWNLRFSVHDGVPHFDLHHTYFDNEGNVWFGTPHGIGKKARNKYTSYLSGRSILRIHQDRMGRMWFGTDNHGTIRFDGSNWDTFKQRRRMIPQFEDERGILWFASDRGGAFALEIAPEGEWSQWTSERGLASNILYSVSQDRNGYLWFSTAAGATRFTYGR